MAILLTITDDKAGQQVEHLDTELFSLFDKSFVVTTPDTSHYLLDKMCRFANVAIRLPLGMAQARRDVLKLASRETGHFFYCDLDRLIYWYNHYREELEDAVKFIHNFDFTTIGRAEKAFQSHPEWQRDTERVMNRVVDMSSIFENNNEKFDFFAGARGISDEVARLVLENSREDWAAQDIEWIRLVEFSKMFTMSYYETNGLAYESEYLNMKRSDEKEINLRIKNLTSVVDYIDRCR